jgi:hypothetical protein
MTTIDRKVCPSGQGKKVGTVLFISHLLRQQQRRAASSPAPDLCPLLVALYHCNATGTTDTLCVAKYRATPRARLLPHPGDRPRHLREPVRAWRVLTERIGGRVHQKMQGAGGGVTRAGMSA